MMRQLFKRDKEIRINPKFYLLIQDKWSKKMSALSADLSKQSMVFYLILFIVVSGGVCIYNVYSGFSSKEKPLRIGVISNLTSAVVTTPPDLNPKAEFENISGIGFYLDSLKESKKGKVIYDSIINFRPGLLDSLDFITKYYKNKF